MKIEHVAMYVNDLESTKEFFCSGYAHIAFSVGSKEKVEEYIGIQFQKNKTTY